MNSPRYRTPVVVALVLIAGCGGLAGSPTPTPTVTPAPVPDPTPTPAPPTEFAPGLTEAGITDADALVGAHLRTVITEAAFLKPFVLRNRYVERYPDGGVAVRVRERHEFEYPRNRHVVTWTGDASGLFDAQTGALRGRAETVCEVEGCLLALTTHNVTTYHEGALFGPWLFTVVSSHRLTRLFASIETSSIRPVERDGSTRYRVEAIGVRDPSAVPTPDRIRAVGNVSFTALVRPSGFVETYRLAYAGRRNGTRVRVTVSIRFTDVGEANVEPSAWIDRAERAVGETNGTAARRLDAGRRSGGAAV